MLHKISDFCNKIDTIKKMSDDLRRMKYDLPKSKERDIAIDNLIGTIQADCLLLAKDKSDYNNYETSETGEYGDYSGIASYSVLNTNKE